MRDLIIIPHDGAVSPWGICVMQIGREVALQENINRNLLFMHPRLATRAIRPQSLVMEGDNNFHVVGAAMEEIEDGNEVGWVKISSHYQANIISALR
jgi:hypothetical protein